MNVLADETVARSTVAMMRTLGHDVIDVQGAGLLGADDSLIAALAESEDRIIITHDKDFGDSLRLQTAKHRGAVILRLHDPSPASTNRVLSNYLTTVADDYTHGRVVILTEHGFRARRID